MLTTTCVPAAHSLPLMLTPAAVQVLTMLSTRWGCNGLLKALSKCPAAEQVHSRQLQVHAHHSLPAKSHICSQVTCSAAVQAKSRHTHHDLGTSGVLKSLDVAPPGANDHPNLVWLDGKHNNAGYNRAELLARRGQALLHLSQDVTPPLLGLLQGGTHDVQGDALHLQGKWQLLC